MTFFSWVVFFTLCFQVTLAHPASIFNINVLEGPAPPPDQGPPISASALRDKSKLPYEIVGILLAYLVWAATTVALILFLGRRLRRRAQTSTRAANMEAAKPRVEQPIVETNTPPMSPTKQWSNVPNVTEVKPWTSPGGALQHKISHASVSTFDEKVIESDKARNQTDLERLYAAVMENEDQKSRSERNSDITQIAATSPTQCPPEFNHLRNENNSNHRLSHPLAPSLIPSQSDPDVDRRTASRASSRFTPLSFLSGHSRASSSNSNKNRPRRISLRGQEISAPMNSPDTVESVASVQEPPLSPRIYTPGPPPAAPIHKSAAATARELDSQPKLRAAAPAPLSLHSTGSSINSLPFRQVYASPPQSAPATRTTYLEKRESKLHPAPKTGVPHTPYSPYMPYTPVTPITPGHLVSKEERKIQQKWVSKKVLSEDDVVKSDEDMWQ